MGVIRSQLKLSPGMAELHGWNKTWVWSDHHLKLSPGMILQVSIMVQLSGVQNHGWLFDIGDEMIPNELGTNFIIHYKEPYINQSGFNGPLDIQTPPGFEPPPNPQEYLNAKFLWSGQSKAAKRHNNKTCWNQKRLKWSHEKKTKIAYPPWN